jgi:hypothetical protein
MSWRPVCKHIGQRHEASCVILGDMRLALSWGSLLETAQMQLEGFPWLRRCLRAAEDRADLILTIR